MDNICSYYLYISISDLYKSSNSKFMIMLDLYFTISNTTVVSSRVHRGRDRIVVGFTTTCAFSP
jgi:hypothetical protein